MSALMRYLVDELDPAVAFYTTRLGFTLAQRMGSAFAPVSLGDLTLWLAGPASSAARAMSDGRRPEPGGWNRLVLEVDDLRQTVDDLRRGGARFRNDVVTGPGGKQILVEDPSGNPIELFEAASA